VPDAAGAMDRPTGACQPPRWLLLACYGTLTVLAGIANTVTFFLMGQKMPKYPMFLLYFTTLLYVTMYGVAAAIRVAIHRRRDKRGWYEAFVEPKHQKQLFLLGLWLIVNGLFSQFSNPYVNGNLQNVLYQLSLPITGVLAYVLLRKSFSIANILGSAMVLAGCLMVALPPLLEETRCGPLRRCRRPPSPDPGARAAATAPT